MKRNVRFLPLDLTLEFLNIADLSASNPDCLDDVQLAEYIDGKSSGAVRKHVEDCYFCRTKINLIKEVLDTEETKSIKSPRAANKNLWVFKLAKSGLDLIQKGREFLFNKEVVPLAAVRGGKQPDATSPDISVASLIYTCNDTKIIIKLLPADEQYVKVNTSLLKGHSATGGVPVILTGDSGTTECQVTDRFRGKSSFMINPGKYTITFKLDDDKVITLPFQLIE